MSEDFGEFYMDKKILNKRGMLLASEVLKIVLAVICIVFLVYLLFSIYYANSNAQNQKEAQSTVGRIGDIISRLNNGAIASESIPDVTPVSWNFVSFVGSQQKPNLCAGADCLCICDTPSTILGIITIHSQISQCDSTGACIAVQNLKSFGTFGIKSVSNGGTTVNITKAGKMIEVLN